MAKLLSIGDIFKVEKTLLSVKKDKALLERSTPVKVLDFEKGGIIKVETLPPNKVEIFRITGDYLGF